MFTRQNLALFACLVLLLAGAAAAYLLGRERLVQSLVDTATLKMLAHRYTDALPDLNRALAIKPNYAHALLLRADVKLAQNDYVGALADADRACSLQADEPTASGYFTARHYRVGIKNMLGDFTGANNDATRALALSPDNAELYAVRAYARHVLGDYSGALEDYDKAEYIVGDPFGGRPFVEFNRGLTHHALGNFPAAADEFRKASEQGRAFGTIWLALTLRAQRLPHETPSAPSAIAALQDTWEAALYGLVTGTVSEAQIFDQAATTSDSFTQRGRYCEAWFYSGMVKRYAGDRAGAAENFRRTLETGRKDFIEYWEARRELQALENPQK